MVDINYNKLPEGQKRLWDEKNAVLQMQNEWFFLKSRALDRLRIHLNRMTYFIRHYKLINTGAIEYSAQESIVAAYRNLVGDHPAIRSCEHDLKSTLKWERMISELQKIDPQIETEPRTESVIPPSLASEIRKSIDEHRLVVTDCVKRNRKRIVELIKEDLNALKSTLTAVFNFFAEKVTTTKDRILSKWYEYQDEREKRREAQAVKDPEIIPEDGFKVAPPEDEQKSFVDSILNVCEKQTLQIGKNLQNEQKKEETSSQDGDDKEDNEVLYKTPSAFRIIYSRQTQTNRHEPGQPLSIQFVSTQNKV